MARDRKSPKPGKGDPAGGAIAVVRDLADILAEHSLTELVYDTPDVTITLRRGGLALASAAAMPHVAMHAPQGAMTAAGSGPVAAAVAEDKGHLVTSPFVGTFYRKPNPDAPNYVSINDRVEKGQVLCIVEAMKLMNEIEADISGTIVGILAEDGAPVEYGQSLFKIAPG